MADTFRDVPGDVKDNFVQLQQSTGETYASMADRIEHPSQTQFMDEPTRAGTKRLADFLRLQSDDPDALARFRPEQPVVDNDGPKGRTAAGGKVNT